ncbi:MAG: HDOD domain-containing protein [Betaproteobacteria bacterium]|nr:HDOD domain-containing protein [Betaproteobacteria bacterium]
MPLRLSEDEIIERASLLPAFPKVVADILAKIDDDNATVSALIELVEIDPVITARVLSVANSAAKAGSWRKGLRDMHVAVSLIGLSRLRQIVISLSLADFARETRVPRGYWDHSVAVGVAAQELAKLRPLQESLLVSVDYALVAGLLHDIGFLWMARFYPLEFQMARQASEQARESTIEIERHYFGVDHCQIGSILAAGWGLPSSIVEAISVHYQPNPASGRLVAIVHVAEILAVALGMGMAGHKQFMDLSDSACIAAGLDWTDDLNPLFGRIEARSRHLGRIFQSIV